MVEPTSGNHGVKPTTRIAALMLAVLTTAAPALATAQPALPEFRGTVRDSASGIAIPGAVVIAMDASGKPVSRTIAGATGTYRLMWEPSAAHIRAVRLGFRPITEPVAQLRDNVATLHLRMTAIPRALEAMQVEAARGCPERSDRTEAFGLLDQARAGLLATVVARERQPAALRVLQFERRLDLDGLEIEQQTVRIDSSINVTTSFNAVHSAMDLVQRGFRAGQNGQYTYYGPDADVLLDERFQNGYCFSLAAPDSARPHVIGLRFTPANRRSRRVDIDGTLWIDTTARSLANIEFRYVGVEVLAESFGAGGYVGFRTLPSGVPFIDRWNLRLIGAPDTLETSAGLSTQSYAIREIGGELVEARWPDGQIWQAPLATMHFTVVNGDGAAAPGVTLNLASTDYRVTTDSAGRATIAGVLPGPYTVVLDDPQLRSIGLQLPTQRAMVVTRSSSVISRLVLPTLASYVGSYCGLTKGRNDVPRLLARVMLPDGSPSAGVKWRLSELANGRWRVVFDGGFTGANGMLQACSGLELGATIELAVWRVASDAVRVRRLLVDTITIMPVTLPTMATMAVQSRAAPVAASSFESTPDSAALTATGVVRDSTSGRPIADARVTFLGTPFEGATDTTGQFTVGGLGPGAYLVEVSTPWMDSIGAVRRTAVSLKNGATSLSLFLPDVQTIFAATCGATDSTSAQNGAVVGRVTARGSEGMTSTMRVVAEWISTTDSLSSGTATNTQWVQAPVESHGVFRLCGVPVNRAFTLRAETDSGAFMTSLPATLIVSSQRQLARVDLLVDSAVAALPIFTGAVVIDSAGTPLENAEVTLIDIGRTVRTNRTGTFRMSDVPAGSHVVSIKQVGFKPYLAALEFTPGQTMEQHVLLAQGVALAPVNVIGQGVPVGFDERRNLGLGRFITNEDLVKFKGRRFGDMLTQIPGFGNPQGVGGRAYVVTKRPSARSLPKTTTLAQATDGVAADGLRAVPCGTSGNPCGSPTQDDFANQGFFCPGPAERAQGILQCACFAQVYLDERLMNPGRPTEPFDVNSIPVSDLAGVEFYSTAASTPGQYSGLNAKCGVLLIWTKQR